VDFTEGDRALSKNLRKRCGIAAVFTALDMLPMLAEEQKEAVGTPPHTLLPTGPSCPQTLAGGLSTWPCWPCNQ